MPTVNLLVYNFKWHSAVTLTITTTAPADLTITIAHAAATPGLSSASGCFGFLFAPFVCSWWLWLRELASDDEWCTCNKCSKIKWWAAVAPSSSHRPNQATEADIKQRTQHLKTLSLDNQSPLVVAGVVTLQATTATVNNHNSTDLFVYHLK